MTETDPNTKDLTLEAQGIAGENLPPAADQLEQTLPADSNIPTLQPVGNGGNQDERPFTAEERAALEKGGITVADANPALSNLTAEQLAGIDQIAAAATEAAKGQQQVPVERVDYTLTSADAAAINVILEDDYVKECLVVNASRDADGALFVQVHEAKVLLGVE